MRKSPWLVAQGGRHSGRAAHPEYVSGGPETVYDGCDIVLGVLGVGTHQVIEGQRVPHPVWEAAGVEGHVAAHTGTIGVTGEGPDEAVAVNSGRSVADVADPQGRGFHVHP